MDVEALTQKADRTLRHLCLEITDRRVGSAGNQEAAHFFAAEAESCGWSIETQPFDAMEWSEAGAHLRVDGEPFTVHVSPYSLGVDVLAPLSVVSTLDELRQMDVTGQVLLVRGELAREPLMPKNFPFYNPEEHQAIYAALEAAQPAALVTATGRHPEMAGGSYPFAMIEDGDFHVPTVHLTEEEGQRLAERAGQAVELTIRAERRLSRGENVIARKGPASGPYLIFTAHLDAKPGTPGATDDGAGIVTLLLLAELLTDYDGKLGIELVAMNGEDYYCAPGEQTYLQRSGGRFPKLALGVNLDGLGFHQGRTAYSLYNCTEERTVALRDLFARFPELVEGEPWYQGDHGLFLMADRPALAITSENLWDVMRITHTTADHPDVVNLRALAVTALALRALVDEMA